MSLESKLSFYGLTFCCQFVESILRHFSNLERLYFLELNISNAIKNNEFRT